MKKQINQKQSPSSQSMAIECPECNSKASITETIENIPHFGKALFSTVYCEKCGFRLSDVTNMDFNEPVGYTAKIEKAKDLETKIVRSSSGTINIPKLGIKIEPGENAEGYITNIEGLLDRVEQVIKTVLSDGYEQQAKDEKRIARKELERVKEARNGQIPFEVTVLDPFGNSALIGEKAKKMKLSKEEADQLKRNIELIEMQQEM